MNFWFRFHCIHHISITLNEHNKVAIGNTAKNNETNSICSWIIWTQLHSIHGKSIKIVHAQNSAESRWLWLWFLKCRHPMHISKAIMHTLYYRLLYARSQHIHPPFTPLNTILVMKETLCEKKTHSKRWPKEKRKKKKTAKKNEHSQCAPAVCRGHKSNTVENTLRSIGHNRKQQWKIGFKRWTVANRFMVKMCVAINMPFFFPVGRPLLLYFGIVSKCSVWTFILLNGKKVPDWTQLEEKWDVNRAHGGKRTE